MRTVRILALLEAAEMLHGITVRRAVLAENDAERAWSELEATAPEKPTVARSFTEAFKCRKRPFGSENAAMRANQTNGHTIRAYVCPACRQWHVTKKDYA